jgi:hypothetical protein
MNRRSLPAIALLCLLSSNLSHSYVHMLPLATLKKTTSAAVIALLAARYFTKESLSEQELVKRRPCQSSSLPTFILQNIDCLLGQRGKEKEISSFDPETGKVTYTKYPALGLGKLEKWMKKHILPIATIGLTIENSLKQIKSGYKWYMDGTPQ